MSDRRKQIEDVAKHEDSDSYFGFVAGAEWADANPIKESEKDLLYMHQIVDREKRIAKLRSALEFYADHKNWKSSRHY